MTMASGTFSVGLQERIGSVDALRGLTVLTWLLSSILPPILYQLPKSWGAQALATQLSPSFWHGITVSDFVLPMFLFVAGVTIVPAFEKREAAGQPKRAVAWLVVRRVVLLLVIGILCEGGIWRHWPDLRLVGVFQRIAICYAVAAWLELMTNWRFQIGALGFFLIDYWAILAFGGSGEGSPYSLQGNAAAAVDQMLLPGRKFFGTWDPQGILTTIPAVAVTTAGLLAGKGLLGTLLADPSRNLWLFCVGAAVIVVGVFGAVLVPVEPHLWTITFCAIVIGVGLALLSFFHAMMDIYRWNAGASVLTVLGRNSLVVVLTTIALLSAVELATRFEGPGPHSIFNVATPACALIILYVVSLVAVLLNRRRIYVTV
jgi:predicted acyltransferase